jgi:hypothetical protein
LHLFGFRAEHKLVDAAEFAGEHRVDRTVSPPGANAAFGSQKSLLIVSHTITVYLYTCQFCAIENLTQPSSWILLRLASFRELLPVYPFSFC